NSPPTTTNAAGPRVYGWVPASAHAKGWPLASRIIFPDPGTGLPKHGPPRRRRGGLAREATWADVPMRQGAGCPHASVQRGNNVRRIIFAPRSGCREGHLGGVEKLGTLAQLVQSACFTRMRSLV